LEPRSRRPNTSRTKLTVIVDDDTITVANADGVVLIEHTRRATGTTYIGYDRPRGPRPNVTEVLTHP